MKNNPFHHALWKVLALNWNNDYPDNFDHFRFGDKERKIIYTQKGLIWIAECLDELDGFYSLLADENSKDLLIKLLAFRILGHRKVRLPLSRPEYWQTIDDLGLFMGRGKTMEATLMRSSRSLTCTDLSPLGYPVVLYTLPRTIMSQFLLKQYQYVRDDGSMIGARPNDVVIDAGACWGDTALFFANAVQNSGCVYSFEFVPDNLKVAYENVRINPQFENTIKIIEHPLWHTSGIRMHYDNNGPGSRIAAGSASGDTGEVSTITIDDFVAQERLTRVDLIKMDIEGAEQHALKGAEQTLRKFRPQLAISIYHTPDDFARVIHVINDFNLGYRFYLNHFTIHYEETVLYATV